MSGDSGSDGPDVGEALLVIACLVALVLSAAFLPTFDVFGETPANADLPINGTGVGTPDLPTNGSGSSTTPPGSPSDSGSPSLNSSAGSPKGGSLSMPPPESGIGSITSDSVESLQQVPLFVVEAPRDGYWRQTAYTGYTGTSWERADEWQPLEEGVPRDSLTADGRDLEYRVRLLSESRSLPTAWQPKSATVEGNDVPLEASTVGAIRSSRPLPENTTFVAKSSKPPRNPDLLRSAGREYPDAIERTYTQLPASTPDRVREFTADLVTDAETPYDAAVTIRDWLRSNRDYSLNASHEAGEPIADQFLFEMDAGYCQYFATTMAVMLRSEGIPARYTVGFAGGDPVGGGEYLVTSDTAHAWVEAYFPEVGWVRFEPTASGSLPVENPQPPFDITLNRSAVAGAPVSITVEKNDSAVVGAPVYVNGDRVGWTGASGTVSTRLPYSANVTISARAPDARDKYTESDGQVADRSRTVSRFVPSAAEVPGVHLAASPGQLQVTVNETVETYESETNATIGVLGDAAVGGSITVNATIRGVPVRNAAVTLDGQSVGETNASGLLVVSLDGIDPGDHEVVVTRGEVNGTETFEVREPTRTATPTPSDGSDSIHVSVSAPFGVPLPIGPATVEVTRNGEPVERASVRVGDEPVGMTDANGTLSASLPLSGAVSVVATSPDGERTETTVSGLYRNALVLVGLLVGALVAIGILASRRGITPASISRTVSTALERIARVTVEALLRLAATLVRLGAKIRVGLGRLALKLLALPTFIAANGLAVLRVFDPRRLLRALRRWLHRQAREAKARLVEDETDGSARGTRSPDATDEGGSRAPVTLRKLWREFVTLVSPPRLSTRTPGEVARYAIDRGLPEEPVMALTDLYRDAEYGQSTTEDSRLERARNALAAIRDRGDDE